MILINYKTQSNRMCYTSNNGAQSNRMSIISEGIEGLVTKTLHTPNGKVFLNACLNLDLQDYRIFSG